MVQIPFLHSEVPKSMKSLTDQSLTVHGGSLFNALPQEIRDWNRRKDTFISKPDEFLILIPENPVLPGMYLEPVC